MSVVYILVFAAILMAGGFLVAFIWSVKSGQYDDTYTPSVRILFDDAVKESGEQGAKSREQKKETEDRSRKSEDRRRKKEEGSIEK